jgi:hypothetical protein
MRSNSRAVLGPMVSAQWLTERPVIELGEQLTDGSVELIQREEFTVAQRRHNPALGDLHGILDLGFIPRLIRPRGHDSKAAMQREVDSKLDVVLRQDHSPLPAAEEDQ